MIPIAKPLMGEEEKKAVLEVLESGMLTSGPRVKEFEQKFAEFVGAKYAVATSNGTTALHAAMLANNIGAGDEVITTAFTFIASANSIMFTGARPVFADIDPTTFTIDPQKIEERITKKTKGILPVHIFGHPCNMDAIEAIAQKHKLAIIEDCCQAHGASYHGVKVGSQNTSCFSFYPTKNMTTSEGGMVTFDDDRIYEKLHYHIAKRVRLLIDHGAEKKYYHTTIGYNFRMTDICAAIGLAQLKKLEGFNQKRMENAAYLTKGLMGVRGIVTPTVEPQVKHVFHQYTIRVTPEYPMSRAELMHRLAEGGVASTVYYEIPIYRQPAYRELGYTEELSVTEQMCREVLSLPVHPLVTREDMEKIIRLIRM